MTASAVFMAALGVVATFAPQETLAFVGTPPGGLGVLLVQIAGALYLGFAMLNWTARANLIGGIYSRPVALGNFLHFSVVALAMLKMLMAGHPDPVVLAGVLVYSAFCVSFGLILFTHPAGAAGK
jgi:hypothetical protein